MKIHSEKGTKNRGSAKYLVDYLSKENLERDPLEHELFFDQLREDVSGYTVQNKLDWNKAKLGKNEAKFYMHDLWYNALRDFEEGTVVHKCDIYLRKRFDSYGMPAKTFLQRETQKHFEGRAYSDHHSFIFFVFNENGKVVNDGYKNPFKKPIKTVEYLKEYERQHKFELTVERCLDYVNNSRYISMEPITEDVFKYLEFSYFNGFYEDRFTDVDLDKMTVGSKHISVMAVNQLKQLGEQVKTWTSRPTAAIQHRR